MKVVIVVTVVAVVTVAREHEHQRQQCVSRPLLVRVPAVPRPVIDRLMTPAQIDALLVRLNEARGGSGSSSSSSAAGGAATGGAGTGSSGRGGVRGVGGMFACWFDELISADGDIMEAVAKRSGFEMGDNLVIFGCVHACLRGVAPTHPRARTMLAPRAVPAPVTLLYATRSCVAGTA